MISRKPHKHAQVIKDWADGYEIEYRPNGVGPWQPLKGEWHEIVFYEMHEYRRKPEPREPERLWVVRDKKGEFRNSLPDLNRALSYLEWRDFNFPVDAPHTIHEYAEVIKNE